MPESPSFVFVTCQVGAEGALKREVAREWPALRFAFSRPGFLTFKLTSDKKLPDDWSERLVFARAAGFCLGKVESTTAEDRAREVWQLLGAMPVAELHVWPRDAHSPGFRDYEPGVTTESAEVERVVREMRPAETIAGGQGNSTQSNVFSSATPPAPPLLRGGEESQHARRGERLSHVTPPSPPLRRGGKRAPVADVIIVGPDEWWVGFHHVGSIVSTWPGGFLQAALPDGAVSRAWLKMQEAVLWSGFNMKRGERCVEIGSAPGGAAQFLLSQGVHVTGIDPAVMDPAVLADEHFRHIRKRSKEVPRKEFVSVDWLTCDVNLPPNYTLDTVRAIVTHPGVRFKGLLLTLKLVEWSLADELPRYLERIRSWGFRRVQARQLHHNRQEVCVAADKCRTGTKSKSRKGRKVEES